jgi:N-sulfoglucosamine sulfohydrolase
MMTTRPPLLRSILLVACLLAAALSAPATVAAETRPAPDAPNILFIIFDDWGGRAHSSIEGSTWIKTPNFDRVAREGILFNNAFTSNPKCAPCRASILTGRNTWQLHEGISHNGYFPPAFDVFPDLLERAGYVVGLTGKGWGPGDFQTLAGRTRNPAGPSFNSKTLTPPTTAINRNDYAGNFEAFLQQRDKRKPFCFWMGFSEPHRAYEPGSGLRLGKKLEDVKVPAYYPDVEVIRSDLLDYAVEVEWGDGHIGRALATLEAAGELENTLVIVTSDHGMPFPYVKGQIFEDGYRLPLAMRWGKGIPAGGRVVEDFINVRDFAPTFLELAGLQPHLQMTGRSLVNILRSDKSGWIENRNEMLVGKERHDLGRPNDMGYPVRALRTTDYLYVRNFHPDRWPAGNPETDFGNVDGSPTKEFLKRLGGHYYELSFGRRPADALFRLADDPECVRNLANDLAFVPVVEAMRKRMMQLLIEDEDPRALGMPEMLEKHPYVAGRGKGYDTWLRAQEQAMPPLAPPSPAQKKAKSDKTGKGSN